MFDIPSTPNVEKCIIKKETILENKEPELVINENKNKEQNEKKAGKKKRQTPAA